MMKRGSKIPSIGSHSSMSSSSSSSSEKPPVKGKYQSVALSQKPTASGSSRSSYLLSYGARTTGRSSNSGSSNGHQNGGNEVKSGQSEKQSKLPQARSGIPKTSVARPNVEKVKDKDVTTNAQPSTTEGNSKEKVQKQYSTGRHLSPKSEVVRAATGRPLTPNSEVLRQVQAASTLSLSESQFNLLSYNLSEIADRISPTHYNSTRVFQFDAAAPGADSFRPRLCSLDRATHSHIKPPYLRKDKDTKLPFAKPKTFKGKTETQTFRYQRTENLPPKSADTSSEESSVETGSESSSSSRSGQSKQESKESGYSSSGTWSSFSLDENLKLDLKDEDNKELREVFADLNVREKSSAKAREEPERRDSRGTVLNKHISDVQDRLDSLIRGKVDAQHVVDNDGSTLGNAPEEDSLACKSKTAGNDVKESVETKTEGHTSDHQNTIVNGEAPEFTKSPFQLVRVQKQSLDDLETGCRRGPQGRVLRRRSTITTFRPPRTMEARQFEEGVVSMDEVGYMTCMNDIKAVKTMLLKLKRELQEADVVSPLSRSYSTSRPSPLSPLAADHSPSGKAMRRSTYDVGMMREKLRRVRTRSFHKPLEDEVFKPASPTRSESPTPAADKEKKENQALKEELKNMKEKFIELTKERDSVAFDKEELEHDMESKNHTIKMLQTQLEKQDNLDEVAYLKRQVKSLTEQVHQQQQKITQLRYRTASPTNPGTAAHLTSISDQKGSVKQEIRVRLRDAFVRHLEESSKSHALLSKQISRTENTISQAQKGLRSLFSPSPSPKCTPSSSREDINHCGRGSKVKKDRAALRNSDLKSHSWTTDTIEKIVKTWKDTHSSLIDTSDSDTSQSLGPGDDIRRMSDPSRLQFL